MGSPLRYLVLASGSPARHLVLKNASIAHRVEPSDVSEEVEETTTAAAVGLLAERKARAVAGRFPDDLVLGCDSMLELDGRSVGKPADAAAAAALWQELAGRRGVLFTGHFLRDGRAERAESRVVGTPVVFGEPSPGELAAYLATKEPTELAGGFSIEGRGAPFIEGIAGEPSNVMGLSLRALREMLGSLGYALAEFWPRPGSLVIEPLAEGDRPALARLVESEWGLPLVSTSGSHDPCLLPGLVARSDGRLLGVLSYRTTESELEVVLLHSLVEDAGVGSSLLAAARHKAEQEGLRLWLITTDENARAIAFYRSRGMALTELHDDFVDTVRRSKPGLAKAAGFRRALRFEFPPPG